MMLTASEFCAVIGRNVSWLESKKRRFKEQTSGDVINADQVDVLPIGDALTEGKWARYDLQDAMRTAIVIEAEDRGLSFREGTYIALNNPDVLKVIGRRSGLPDLFVGKIEFADMKSHVSGTWREVSEKVARAEGCVAVFFVNASTVWQRLQLRAEKLGLTEKLHEAP